MTINVRTDRAGERGLQRGQLPEVLSSVSSTRRRPSCLPGHSPSRRQGQLRLRSARPGRPPATAVPTVRDTIAVAKQRRAIKDTGRQEFAWLREVLPGRIR